MISRFERYKGKIFVLRRRGKSYEEIRRILGIDISKGTLSYWCRDIPLPAYYQQRISRLIEKGSRSGLRVAQRRNRAKWDEFLDSVKAKALSLSSLYRDKRVAKVALAMLYLGEGAKWKGHRGLHLGSSDPEIVRIYLNLLKKCYGVSAEKISARIAYRADQNIKKLITFWSRVTGIPSTRFYKTRPDPRTKGKRTLKKDYYGVCAITCGGTDIQLELDFIARGFLKV